MAASPSSDSVSPGPSPEGGESRLRTPGGSPAAASDGIAPLTGHWGAPAAPAWKPPHLQHSCRSRNQASGGTEAGRVVKGGREVYQAARTSASPTSAAPSLTPLLLPKCHCPQGPVCDFSSILEPRPLSSDNSRIPPSGLEPPLQLEISHLLGVGHQALPLGGNASFSITSLFLGFPLP